MLQESPIKITFNCFVILLLGIGCILPSKVLAQKETLQLSDKDLREIKRSAKSALRLGDIYSALFYYEEWAKRDTLNGKIIYQTADLFRLSRNYVQAEKWYSNVPKEEKGLYNRSLFYLAEVQIAQGKYQEAKQKLLQFKEKLSEFNDPIYKKYYKIRLQGCELALTTNDSISTVGVRNLGKSVNLPHIEFSPVAINDSVLIYGSLREKRVKFYEVDSITNIPLRALYVAEKEGENWIAKGELRGPFNTSDKNVGNAVLSEDGKRMYFTLCSENWQGKVVCHLYYSDKKSGKWSNAVKMNGEINLPNYTTTQPAIGRESKKNQEVVYFVSDRPGGKGGLDIWYTEFNKKRKKFKSPKNAGSKVNTFGTDCTPYYDNEGHRLYYSSDGLVGFGGLDVFSVEGEKSKWGETENMKKAINSSADDLDYTLLPNRKGGFFVSNREGGTSLLSSTCCDDIYEFSYLKYVDLYVDVEMKDENENCLKNYLLNLYVNNSIQEDKYLSKQYKVDSCGFKVRLQKGVDYSIEVKKDGYFNFSTDISTKQIDKTGNFVIERSLIKRSDEPIRLENILYEFDSDKLTLEAKRSIDDFLFPILTSNKTLVVQIASHTDSKGNDAYNLDLSQRRAQSVVRYLIEKGINSTRLEAKGYGESSPIASNINDDGSDSPEGRRKNRRTEFKVIGEVTIEGEFSDSK